jgi:Concanavalin A-like lectin/glucanases superfamily
VFRRFGLPWTSAGAAALLVVTLVAAAPASNAAGPAAPACDPVRPDRRSASLLAHQCGRPVEILAGRSENAQVFANPDGTSTFTSTAVPVRVHRSDGSWVPVDPTLRLRADGTVAPVATVTDMVFSGGGSGPFATYRDKGSTLTVGLPVSLPKPRLVGDTAIYPDVLPGIDLRVTASATTFRHVLVVKTAAAAASLGDVSLTVGGNVTVTSAGDRIRFADPKGHLIAVSEPATMWDSSVNPGEAGEVKAGMSRAALDALRNHPPAEMVSDEHRPGITARSAAVTVSAEAGGHGFRLTPDASMLAHPVLPLFIDPPITLPEAFWAYSMSGNYNYTMDGKAWVGINPPCCGGDGSYFRAFFQFPTTSQAGQTYKGKHIISASFSITLYHSWSCGPTPTTAYSTLGIYVGNGGRMDFNARPLGAGATFIGSASGNANKAGGCGVNQPNMLMTFGGGEAMRSDVQRVATGNGDAYAIGLCACDSDGANEGVQDRWKKFLIDGTTSMSVTYNTVPATPDSLSPNTGIACNSFVGTKTPALTARYVDADTNDTLSATFRWQQVGSPTVNTVSGPAKPANNFGSVTVDLGPASENQQYQFQVQTFDGNDYSPWSLWCQFTVDTAAPPPPVVTPTSHGSDPVYSACTPSDCTAAGGPGQAGAFTFSEPAGGQDTVTYQYGIDAPSAQISVGPGAQATVMVTPTHYGLNHLVVKSNDAAGHFSDTASYSFVVDSPEAESAHWPLDDVEFHGLFDQIAFDQMTGTGWTWTPDVRYPGAQGVSFDGTGGLSQLVPLFTTTASYSVAAWVRVAPGSWCSSGEYTIVSMDGDADSSLNRASVFQLNYDCGNHKWLFAEQDRNVTNPTRNAVSSANGSAVPGRWTLLVGSFDMASNTSTLWMNGAVVAQGVAPASWVTSYAGGFDAPRAPGDTPGPIVLGRNLTGGSEGGRLQGQIADVRVYNRVLVDEDINGTDIVTDAGTDELPGLLTPLVVGAWTFPGSSTGQSDDESVLGRPVWLVPNPALVQPPPSSPPASLIPNGHDHDGGGLLLNNSGYATTTDDNATQGTSDDVTHTILRTDQSVTVSAWVLLDTITDTDQVVLHSGAVNLMYHGNGHKWAFTVQTPNGSGGYINDEALANDAATPNTWVYLVGEFDVTTGSVRLWVNHVLQTNTSTGAVGFYRDESLTIGSISGLKPLAGTIDVVQVWQGLLNDREIKHQYDTT